MREHRISEPRTRAGRRKQSISTKVFLSSTVSCTCPRSRRGIRRRISWWTGTRRRKSCSRAEPKKSAPVSGRWPRTSASITAKRDRRPRSLPRCPADTRASQGEKSGELTDHKSFVLVDLRALGHTGLIGPGRTGRVDVVLDILLGESDNRLCRFLCYVLHFCPPAAGSI